MEISIKTIVTLDRTVQKEEASQVEKVVDIFNYFYQETPLTKYTALNQPVIQTSSNTIKVTKNVLPTLKFDEGIHSISSFLIECRG